MSAPLTPQEKSIFSRYGNNNFSFDAFKSGAAIMGGVMGGDFGESSGLVPLIMVCLSAVVKVR